MPGLWYSVAFSILADCIKHWMDQSDINLSFYDILFKQLYKYSKHLCGASLAQITETVFHSVFIPDLN